MPNHILITGGTGMVGTRLTELLQEKGYRVAHLSRRRTGTESVKTYLWNIDRNELEPEAIEKAEAIIHLAGANLSAKRWSESVKKILITSRTHSAHLLYEKLKTLQHSVTRVIAASGINYYGTDTGDRVITEEMPPGKGFVSQLCVKWEESTLQFEQLGIRTALFRIMAALSVKGGFLKPILPLAKAGLASPIGHGRQYISWIHIDDLCRMFIKALEDEKIRGTYNAAAPNPAQNKIFMKKLAKTLRRPFFLPNAPGFAVRLVFGEMADLALGGVRASAEKIERSGFTFRYPELDDALKNIFQNRR